jgi:hypothetical protein
MPRHHCLLTVIALLLASVAFSQKTIEVTGKLIDSSGNVLSNINVKIRSGQDSTGSRTGINGAFSLRVADKGSVTIDISGIGYKTYSKKYDSPGNRIDAGTIILEQDAVLIGEVVVKSVNPVVVKEDTVQYDASAYKVREGAPVEDVIKKLPGVTVDKEGEITAQGKPVTRVRVNGKDFFGGDAKTATQNLPADVIENIQIIDDYGDQANLTGVKSGEPEKIININIRKDKNRGQFGTATVAAGNEGRYAAGLVANNFKDEQQISFLGAINNTNSNLFNFNGGGRGGGARGTNFGGGERGGGGGAGITLSKSAGINYRDAWGKKIAVYGSYSFSSRSTNVISTSLQQDINPLNIRSTARTSNNRSGGDNHRATFNFEYRMDSMNYLKVSPYVSLSTSRSNTEGESEISRPSYYTFNTYRSGNESTAPNSGGDLSFNHRFRKKQRNLNVYASINYSYRDQDQESRNSYANDDSTFNPIYHFDTLQQQQIGIANRNLRTNTRLSYTEPLDATGKTFIEFNYDWNRSATNNAREVEDIDPATGNATLNEIQSNHFDYQFTTNRIGVNIKGSKPKYNYVIGMIAQPSTLSGQSVGKGIETNYHNTNWIPSARFVYNFARSHSLTLTYGGNSREPDFMQLQPVTDSSNLNNIVVGNPNLQAELTRTLSLQYNKFDNKSGRSLFTNLSFNQTNNKIVNSRVNNPSGTGRTTSYLNTDGFYNINFNGSITRPFSNRRFVPSVSFNANYNNNISYTDNQRTKGNNWNMRPSASFRVDIDDIIDVTANASYTIYQTTTTYTTFTNTTKARTLNIGINGRNYFFKDLTIGYDFSKNINYGFSSSVNSNPVILNLYAEYRFLKNRATVKLQGYDLFNQNTGINRSIYETTITDSRSNRLARYFLLTLNYRVQKFGGKGVRMNGQRGTREPRDRR